MVDLAWPAIVGMSFYALNTFVDVIFIGQLVGEQAVAGVSLAFPLASIPMGVAAMLGSGGGSLLSIAIGAGDSALHKRLSGLTGSLAIIATLPMAAAGAVFPNYFCIGWADPANRCVWVPSIFRFFPCSFQSQFTQSQRTCWCALKGECVPR